MITDEQTTQARKHMSEAVTSVIGLAIMSAEDRPAAQDSMIAMIVDMVTMFGDVQVTGIERTAVLMAQIKDARLALRNLNGILSEVMNTYRPEIA
jgi:hypothetical protein